MDEDNEAPTEAVEINPSSDERDTLMGNGGKHQDVERGDGDFGDPLTTRLWVTGSVVLLLCYYFFAAMYFKYMETWEWVDSFYFAVVTLTTVGYGQFVPTHMETRLGTCFFIITGVFISAVVVATIQQSVIHTLSERNSLGQSRWRELLAPTFLTTALTGAYCCWVHFYDGMPWDKAFYFVIVSFSSVGYGDVLLKDQVSRAFGIGFLLVGCACWTYLLTSILTVIVTRFQLHHMKAFCREKITRERQISTRRMILPLQERPYILTILNS